MKTTVPPTERIQAIEPIKLAVARLCAETGLKIGEVLERAGMSRQLWSDKCKGESPFELAHVRWLADVFGLTPLEFLEIGLAPKRFEGVSASTHNAGCTFIDLVAAEIDEQLELWHVAA